MQDLNDLHYFARVVEAGGFAAAGRLLGIPKSRLSRRIAELEQRLGVRLLQRTTRKLALTDIGERFLRHCQAMLLEAEQAEETVAALSSEPRGRLRVSCPQVVPGFQETLLSFLASYPQVQVEVLITSRRVDLINEGVDVAMRVRTLDDEDPSLITRRLSPAEGALVAAPSLLEGHRIAAPEDLLDLPALGALEADRKVHYRLEDKAGNRRDIALEPRLGIEDFAIRKAAALAGLGMTLLPRMYCEEELNDGRLLQLLPGWEVPSGYLQAVYPHRSGMLPAVRAWLEHLTAAYQASPEPR
ncbi:LysR substrate-binding domain-containing protein [Zestomonas carbonaria]|uniref:HTH-type transcriptional regulator DmlR n=1 Tax=Zestomonas carbonaria TaxID=2762745 RepID=A0A7U7IBE4_9GAMM|nr:LysR substrate-binding domain-containing protein [Pseudomonas carbonaria]CAD5110395.1 HTH-type transcriptional regulator DmlR [Pseudomonas carbonaria]